MQRKGERVKQKEIGWKVLTGLRLGRGCGVSTHTTGLDGLGDQCSYQSYCTSFPAPPVPLRARTLLGLSRPPYPIRVPCGRPRWAARSSTYSYQSAGSPEAGLGPLPIWTVVPDPVCFSRIQISFPSVSCILDTGSNNNSERRGIKISCLPLFVALYFTKLKIIKFYRKRFDSIDKEF